MYRFFFVLFSCFGLRVILDPQNEFGSVLQLFFCIIYRYYVELGFILSLIEFIQSLGGWEFLIGVLKL